MVSPFPTAAINIGLVHPITDGLLRRFELPTQLPRTATRPHQANHLRPELHRIRRPRSRHRTLLPRDTESQVFECPPKRVDLRVRDLPVGNRPTVLVWSKRVWRCPEAGCSVNNWSETSDHIRPRAVLSVRARRVGEDGASVAAVARSLGVGWSTVIGRYANSGSRWSPNSCVRCRGCGPWAWPNTVGGPVPIGGRRGSATWKPDGCWRWCRDVPGPLPGVFWPLSRPKCVTGWGWWPSTRGVIPGSGPGVAARSHGNRRCGST